MGGYLFPTAQPLGEPGRRCRVDLDSIDLFGILRGQCPFDVDDSDPEKSTDTDTWEHPF